MDTDQIKKDAHARNDPLIRSDIEAMFQNDISLSKGRDLRQFLEDEFKHLKTWETVTDRQSKYDKGYWVPMVKAMRAFESLRWTFLPVLSVILFVLEASHAALVRRL